MLPRSVFPKAFNLKHEWNVAHHLPLQLILGAYQGNTGLHVYTSTWCYQASTLMGLFTRSLKTWFVEVFFGTIEGLSRRHVPVWCWPWTQLEQNSYHCSRVFTCVALKIWVVIKGDYLIVADTLQKARQQSWDLMVTWWKLHGDSGWPTASGYHFSYRSGNRMADQLSLEFHHLQVLSHRRWWWFNSKSSRYHLKGLAGWNLGEVVNQFWACSSWEWVVSIPEGSILLFCCLLMLFWFFSLFLKHYTK